MKNIQEENFHKSYYAIIPAIVRYDKDLKPNEKLMYGELTALSNEKGYCWANNNYFAELYDVSAETVSRWISNLSEKGYISVVIDSKSGNKRKVFIKENLLTKKSIPIDEKINTPIDEKVKHNNTITNNIINDNISPSVSKETKKQDIKIINYIEIPSQTLEEKIVKQFHALFCKLRTKEGEVFNNKVLLGAKMSSWKVDLDKIMRIDKRSKEDLLLIYNFIKDGDDRFWANTISSLGGIRKNFDMIRDSISREKDKKASMGKNKKEEENPSIFKGDINRITKK